MTMGEIGKRLAKNLKALRTWRGLTQESLAVKAGLSLGGYQNIEYERRWPSDATLGQIARALDVPETALFSDKDLALKPSVRDALDVITEFIKTHPE